VVDQSGNLMEWTGTQVGSSPATYRIRGGSYFSIEPALTCDFDFISAEPDYRYDDLGFRCCADTYPP
jgi:formylglycine-generating enzyme required for sulfatase activity